MDMAILNVIFDTKSHNQRIYKSIIKNAPGPMVFDRCASIFTVRNVNQFKQNACTSSLLLYINPKGLKSPINDQTDVTRKVPQIVT